jgi:hypothetical protein
VLGLKGLKCSDREEHFYSHQGSPDLPDWGSFLVVGGTSSYALFPTPLSEVRALRCRPALALIRAASLVLVRQDGLSLPPLVFHSGGLPELLGSLRKVGASFKYLNFIVQFLSSYERVYPDTLNVLLS